MSVRSILGQHSSLCGNRLEKTRSSTYQPRILISGKANLLPPIISRFEFIAIACIGGKSRMPSGTPCMTLCTVYSSSSTISWSNGNRAARQISDMHLGIPVTYVDRLSSRAFLAPFPQPSNPSGSSEQILLLATPHGSPTRALRHLGFQIATAARRVLWIIHFPMRPTHHSGHLRPSR
jgi:hypothetical protein